MRLPEGGRLERLRPIAVRFDGREYAAYPGDTLASALLAGGVRVFGRSFKYHRPRGLLAAGPEEPNALVKVGGVPNTRATVVEAFDGLVARSQNAWPGRRFDAMAVNDLLAPLLGAGFYYKTFMWPRGFWERVYEPAIRRAAGLGTLPRTPDPDACEKAFAFCDLLVIGGGPAGLMAALTAGRAGARVILADEDFRFGGRLNAERIAVGRLPGGIWADDVTAELAGLPNVRLMPRTTVFGAYDGGTYGAVERVAEHLAAPPEGLPVQCLWRIVARRAVLCAGAIERPIAFPDNDRPGVMLAGAVRAHLNRWAVAPARAAVFTNNDDGWRTAADLAAAGVEVAALIDVRPGPLPEGDWARMPGAQVVGTRGRRGLREIRVRQGGREHRLAVDCLAVSGGWNPSLHLSSHLGARPVWDEAIAAFVPAEGAVPGMRVAGAAAGVLSTQGALNGGEAAAMAVLADLGLRGLVAVPEAEDADVEITPFWRVEAPGRAWLDLQNAVTV
jgi:sarcosine oxidase subunit alpha